MTHGSSESLSAHHPLAVVDRMKSLLGGQSGQTQRDWGNAPGARPPETVSLMALLVQLILLAQFDGVGNVIHHKQDIKSVLRYEEWHCIIGRAQRH